MDFEFFLITQQEGLAEPINGVLGLARDMPYYLVNKDKDEVASSMRGPSYLHALRNAEIITEASVSFMISPFGLDSEIDLGPHKGSRLKPGTKLEWL